MKLSSIRSLATSTIRWLERKLLGNVDYRKFVIISRSRTGSTLLMSLLNDHPEVDCNGEIFKNLNGKSCQKIWDRQFGKRNKQVKQVGFRLFYYHPFDGGKEVWDLLSADNSIYIIHLTRTNMLRTLTSQRIGMKSQKWTQRKGDSEPIQLKNKQVELSVEECQEFFRETKEYERQTSHNFIRQNRTEISYEELVDNQSTVVNSIFKLLGLRKHNSSSTLQKQNPEPLSSLISNYAELKIAFTSSEYESFFD